MKRDLAVIDNKNRSHIRFLLCVGFGVSIGEERVDD